MHIMSRSNYEGPRNTTHKKSYEYLMRFALLPFQPISPPIHHPNTRCELLSTVINIKLLWNAENEPEPAERTVFESARGLSLVARYLLIVFPIFKQPRLPFSGPLSAFLHEMLRFCFVDCKSFFMNYVFKAQ